MPKVTVTDLVTSDPGVFPLSCHSKIKASEEGTSSVCMRKEIVRYPDSGATLSQRTAWGCGMKHRAFFYC